VEAGPEGPDVLLVPYYFYLSYEGFRRIRAALAGRGLDARLLCMHFNAHNERETYGGARLQRDQVPALDLELDLTGMGVPGIAAKFAKLFHFARNRGRIRTFLRTRRPRLVVVESDLGGIYIRSLLDECRAQGIPCAIAMTLDVGQAVAPGYYARWPVRLLNALVGWSPWLRAILVRTEVVGSYARRAPILTPSAAMQERLVSGGIRPDRIQVTGSPQQDQVFELRSRDRQAARAGWLRDRGLPPDTRIVVLCFEVIEEVLGQDYVRQFHPRLAAVLDRLPEDCRVVLRFHPRERPDNLAFYRECFRGPRYLEAPDCPLDDLLHLSHLCLGHFTSVLVKAVALGTPILSVNLARSTRTALFALDQTIPQILDEADLDKVRRALTDPGYGAELRSFLDRWASGHFPGLDGRRSATMAEILEGMLGPRRA
jgi:hypothetical protein